jgi:hypothetical protein
MISKKLENNIFYCLKKIKKKHRETIALLANETFQIK